VPAGADLALLSSPDLSGRTAGLLLAVPLGSTEQHGPHLPLGTDTEIAAALCRRLADRRVDVLVAPAVPYGASGEHASFAGTVSIGTEALTGLLVELVRSAHAFAGVILVSGHGGNASAVARAVAVLTGEGRRVLAWSPAPASDAGPAGDLHAGWSETSAMLALQPAAVRLDRAEAGVQRPLSELMPAMRTGGVAAVSANGVLGDPDGATAGAGEQLLEGWASDLAEAVRSWT
jgi:creatinine amidohydrolase